MTPEEKAAHEAWVRDSRTCQICGRPIHAASGVIAHHGYERPSHKPGLQTPSCWGARHLPFEVSRDELGKYLVWHQNTIDDMIASLAAFQIERPPIVREERKKNEFGNSLYDSKTGNYIMHMVEYPSIHDDYPRLFAIEVSSRETDIRLSRQHQRDQQKRWDGWVQTEFPKA